MAIMDQRGSHGPAIAYYYHKVHVLIANKYLSDSYLNFRLG